MKHLDLIFFAQCRAQEWLQKDFYTEWCFSIEEPIIVESKDWIFLIVDAFEDRPFTHIRLSLN